MYIADLHIHSRYSRATSKDCTPEYLDLWARRKGIQIVGTGDFTHPAWREELKEKLEPDREGLYVLKKEYRISHQAAPDSFVPRFVVSGEISSIYKKNGRVRKVHSLILLPGLEDAERISRKLETIGNIHSDGRPILGLDCHDLLEILLELCPSAVYVPAHIWTPHFSLFGAFSGFDSVTECFEDLSPWIRAVETGLSSDPPMNWRVSQLDGMQLISNSDAHSPSKLGREANLFDIELSWQGLRQAILEGRGLTGTIEFFPEEGKYHFDGHRKCGICLSPEETEKYKGICPVCGRKITIGVSHRVEQLADRPEGYVRADARKFESLVPLPEVIGASVGHSSASKSVQKEYMRLIQDLGPEFEILRRVPLEDIRKTAGTLISDGIGRLRRGQVERIPGFDGEYGTIRLFTENEIGDTDGQMSLFGLLGDGMSAAPDKEADRDKDFGQEGNEGAKAADSREGEKKEESPNQQGLNPAQEEAVKDLSPYLAVVAGPGTGKTSTLVTRILYMLDHRKIKMSEITAVTFTNRAADEMRERIRKHPGKKRSVKNLQIGTFHAICLKFLKEQGEKVILADEEELQNLAEEVSDAFGTGISGMELLRLVSLRKSLMEPVDALPEEAFRAYQGRLEQERLYDPDDLLLKTIEYMEHGQAAAPWKKRFTYLLIDEFQDINPLQYRLVRAWMKYTRELFVIGDPDQSIYGFRGSVSTCFEQLKQDLPSLKTIRLMENYRSTPEILNLALRVISKNPGEERRLHPNTGSGTPVRLVTGESEMQEAVFLAKEIGRMAGGVGMLEAHALSGSADSGRKIRSFDEIGVLYRTHHQARILEKCLKQEGIPYVVAGRDSFLMEDTVRGTIGFLRYLRNQEDVHAGSECLQYLWGLDENPVASGVLENARQEFAPIYASVKPEKLLEMWISRMGLEANGAMEKLKGMSLFYKTTDDFLDALELGVESDLRRCGKKKYTSDAVTLMTLHGSKGLEFPAVLIFGTEKGLIPFESATHKGDICEERRLFYVGLTRAREELILTASGEESEFLQEIQENILTREKLENKRKTEEFHQMSLFDI